MKSFILVFIGIFTFCNAALAGPESGTHKHSREITRQEAVDKADRLVDKLIKKGRLEASWGEKLRIEAMKKDFGNGDEWVVSFANAKIRGDKNTLYVFISLSGKILAANFKGY